jgi:hypothetical protein
MLLIQVLIELFVAFALVRTWKQFRAGKLSKKMLAVWAFFWAIVAVAVALPQTTDIAARFVGVGRGADLAIYISLIVLFYLVFRVYVKIEDVERDITKLVRKLALEKEEGPHTHV